MVTGRRSALVAAMVIILAGALAADFAWARGRGGGHGGGKGGGARASAHAGGGARAAHAGTASTGGARAANSGGTVTGGARMALGGARMMAGNAGGANPGGALAVAGAPAAGGGRGLFARAGGGFPVLGALGAFGAFPRIDGRFYGFPPPRTGAAVGLAALWEVPPPNYPAPVVIVPYRQPEYIETDPDAPVVAPPKNFWYFCPDAGGYYPYVEECPEGWELVAPPGALPLG